MGEGREWTVKEVTVLRSVEDMDAEVPSFFVVKGMDVGHGDPVRCGVPFPMTP